MELRHLRYFVAVADDLSVTRAAAQLNIAQPALSHQIKSLEREIGTQLLQRLARGVALTGPGELFAADARAILAAVGSATSRARLAAAGGIGTIRIGFVGSASFHPFVTGAIRDYRAAYPDVQIELVEEPTANLIAGLKAGRVEVAFLRPAAGDAGGLSVRHLFDEPMVVAVPLGHPLSGSHSVALAALAGEPFIFYPRRNGRALYDAIVFACESAGFTPLIAQDAPQLTSVLNLVATGIAIAIVPASMKRLSKEEVRYVAIEGKVPVAPMSLARPGKSNSLLSDLFVDLVLSRLPSVSSTGLSSAR